MNDMTTSAALCFSPLFDSYGRIVKRPSTRIGTPFRRYVLLVSAIVPRDDVDVVDGIVLLRSAVNGDRKLRHRRTALHITDLRIADEVANKDYTVVISHFSSPLRCFAPLDDRKQRAARDREDKGIRGEDREPSLESAGACVAR